MRALAPALLRLAAIALAAVPVAACKAESAMEKVREEPPLILTGRVVDAANLLTSQDEASLVSRLEALERDTGVEFVVVTTPDLAGRDITEYSLALGNGWGIGDAKRNDGLLFVVAPNERKVRISTGVGMERKLTDQESTKLIEQVLPYFRRGDLPGGVLHGAQILDSAVRAKVKVAA